MQQPSLFAEPAGSWKPPETLPELQGRYKRIGFDTESTGLDYLNDVPVGLSISLPDGPDFYLPWGHRGGGNLDPALIKRWAKHELPGLELCGSNLKHDAHTCKNADLDLEAWGCKLRDVGYQTALLDDHRRKFGIDLIAQERGLRGKDATPGFLPGERIADLHSSHVGPYAMRDARLALDVWNVQQRDIIDQGLTTVLDMEDELTWVTVEMERNQVKLDVSKMQRWQHEVRNAYGERIIDVFHKTGMRINPNSGPDMARLLNYLQVPHDGSFTEPFLKGLKHPIVNTALEARQLDSLDSKYLKKYLRLVDRDGLLRYQLHQLRSDEYGTVSGRYSSANTNIQQVMKEDKQEAVTLRWIIRELFIPCSGRWTKADASQIEFRWFAHYANAVKVIEAYNRDPKTDFHAVVAALVNMPRTFAKNVNFAKMYGSGRDKLSLMTGLPRRWDVTHEDAPDWRTWAEPGQPNIDDVVEEYERLFPEAKRLMNFCMDVAGRRGYVRTILNRRSRFPAKERLHKALNSVLQGTAADNMKLKLIQIYKERKFLDLTMRFTVHDELDADQGTEAKFAPYHELLQTQVLPCKVPIIWDLEAGTNWHCKEAA